LAFTRGQKSTSADVRKAALCRSSTRRGLVRHSLGLSLGRRAPQHFFRGREAAHKPHLRLPMQLAPVISISSAHLQGLYLHSQDPSGRLDFLGLEHNASIIWIPYHCETAAPISANGLWARAGAGLASILEGQIWRSSARAERAGRGIWRGSYVEPWLYRACIRANGQPLACSDDANAHP